MTPRDPALSLIFVDDTSFPSAKLFLNQCDVIMYIFHIYDKSAITFDKMILNEIRSNLKSILGISLTLGHELCTRTTTRI